MTAEVDIEYRPTWITVMWAKTSTIGTSFAFRYDRVPANRKKVQGAQEAQDAPALPETPSVGEQDEDVKPGSSPDTRYAYLTDKEIASLRYAL